MVSISLYLFVCLSDYPLSLRTFPLSLYPVRASPFRSMDARFYNTDEVVSKSVLAAMPEKYLNSTSVASEEWATKIQTMSRDIRATYNPMDEVRQENSFVK